MPSKTCAREQSTLECTAATAPDIEANAMRVCEAAPKKRRWHATQHTQIAAHKCRKLSFTTAMVGFGIAYTHKRLRRACVAFDLPNSRFEFCSHLQQSHSIRPRQIVCNTLHACSLSCSSSHRGGYAECVFGVCLYAEQVRHGLIVCVECLYGESVHCDKELCALNSIHTNRDNIHNHIQATMRHILPSFLRTHQHTHIHPKWSQWDTLALWAHWHTHTHTSTLTMRTAQQSVPLTFFDGGAGR